LLTNLFHWFFGFEYWYISRETSNLILSQGKQQDSLDKARFYAVIKWTGIVLNATTSGLLGYYEWRFENDLYKAYTSGRNIPRRDVYTLVVMEYVVAILMFASCLFLADALRRFKQQSTIRKNIVLNHKLMYVHISVVVLQVVVSLAIFTIVN